MSFLIEDCPVLHLVVDPPILAPEVLPEEPSERASQQPAAARLAFVSEVVELEHERYSCSAVED